MRYPRSFTIIDTETTGLDVKKEMAWEISAIKMGPYVEGALFIETEKTVTI